MANCDVCLCLLGRVRVVIFHAGCRNDTLMLSQTGTRVLAGVCLDYGLRWRQCRQSLRARRRCRLARHVLLLAALDATSSETCLRGSVLLEQVRSCLNSGGSVDSALSLLANQNSAGRVDAETGSHLLSLLCRRGRADSLPHTKEVELVLSRLDGASDAVPRRGLNSKADSVRRLWRRA